MNEYDILNEALEKLKLNNSSIDELKSAVEMKKYAAELKSMWVSRSLAVVSILISGILLAYQIYVLTQSNDDGLLDRYHKTLTWEIEKLEDEHEGISIAKRDLEQDVLELKAQIKSLKEMADANKLNEQRARELVSTVAQLNQDIINKTNQLDNATDIQALNRSLETAQQAAKIARAQQRVAVKQQHMAFAELNEIQAKFASFEPIEDFVSDTIKNAVVNTSMSVNSTDGRTYHFEIAAINTRRGNFDVKIDAADGKTTTVTNLYGDRYFFSFDGIGFMIQASDLSLIKEGQLGNIDVGFFSARKAKLIY